MRYFVESKDFAVTGILENEKFYIDTIGQFYNREEGLKKSEYDIALEFIKMLGKKKYDIVKNELFGEKYVSFMQKIKDAVKIIEKRYQKPISIQEIVLLDNSQEELII